MTRTRFVRGRFGLLAALVWSLPSVAFAQSELEPEVYAVWGPQPATKAEEPQPVRAGMKDPVRQPAKPSGNAVTAAPTIKAKPAIARGATLSGSTPSGSTPSGPVRAKPGATMRAQPMLTNRIPSAGRASWISKPSWDEFKKAWETASAKGLRLVDVEVHQAVSKEPRYHGLFVPGQGSHDLRKEDFSGGLGSVTNKNAFEPQEVIDFEVLPEAMGGGFVAVKRSGTRKQDITLLQRRDWSVSPQNGAFESASNRYQRLLEKGDRIDDIEVVDGKLWILTTEAKGASLLIAANDYKAFSSQWERLAKQGYRLIDLEPYAISSLGLIASGKSAPPKFLAVFHKREGAYALLGGREAVIKKKQSEFAKGGLQLSDLEFYIDPNKSAQIAKKRDSVLRPYFRTIEGNDKALVRFTCSDKDRISLERTLNGLSLVHASTCKINGYRDRECKRDRKLRGECRYYSWSGSDPLNTNLYMGETRYTIRSDWNAKTKRAREKITFAGRLQMEITTTSQCNSEPFTQFGACKRIKTDILYKDERYAPGRIELANLRTNEPILRGLD